MTALTRSSSKQLFIYIVCGIGALTGFLFGFDSGVISGAILFIKQQFHLTAGGQELVISVVLFGAIVGAVFSGRLSDYFGRQRLLLVSAVVFVIGTLISAYAGSVTTLVWGRLFLGAAIGVTSSVAPVYLSELSPYEIRGALIALYQLAITLGIFVSYLIDYAFSKSGAWHDMLGIGVIPAVILLFGLLFLPKSPRWLMAKGRASEAEKVLGKLREAHRVKDEINDIKSAIEEEGRANWKLLFSRWAMPALVVAVGMAILQQLVGINTIIYYGPTIFNVIGFKGAEGATAAAIIIGVVNVGATFLGMYLIDKLGRRPLVLMGLVLMIAGHLILAWAFHYHHGMPAALRVFALLGMISFIVGFAASLGIISWVLNAEVFPLKIRGLGSSMAATSNWVFNALVSSTFLTLVHFFGESGTFFMYAIICCIGMVLVAIFMPETKGITLERLEHNLHKGVSIRHLGDGPGAAHLTQAEVDEVRAHDR
ncbi:MAG: MFS transporter [Legionellaceae bacterium]|nr:MFS transporter [Legionellaceae bacterium]